MLCTGCGVGGTPETLSKGAALHRGALLWYEQLGEEHGCQEILTLLARSVVDVLGGWEADGRTPAALAAAMKPYDSLYSIAWWDVPRYDPLGERPLLRSPAPSISLQVCRDILVAQVQRRLR